VLPRAGGHPRVGPLSLLGFGSRAAVCPVCQGPAFLSAVLARSCCPAGVSGPAAVRGTGRDGCERLPKPGTARGGGEGREGWRAAGHGGAWGDPETQRLWSPCPVGGRGLLAQVVPAGFRSRHPRRHCPATSVLPPRSLLPRMSLVSVCPTQRLSGTWTGRRWAPGADGTCWGWRWRRHLNSSSLVTQQGALPKTCETHLLRGG